MDTITCHRKKTLIQFDSRSAAALTGKLMALTKIIPEKEFLVEDRIPLLGSSHVLVDVGYGHQEVVLVADENSC